MAEKMRVHILAKELNVPSKVVVDKCRAEGVDSVKNHMSTLSAGLHATIREWFSEGSHATTVETAGRVDLQKVRVRRRKKREPTAEEVREAEAAKEEESLEVPAAAPSAEVISFPAVAETPAEAAATVATPTAFEAPIEPPDTPPSAPEIWLPGTDVAVAEAPPAEVVAETAPAIAGEGDVPIPFPAEAAASLDMEPPPVVLPEPSPAPEAKPKPITPAGPQNVPTKAKLQGPRVVRYEAPDYLATRRPRGVGERSPSRTPAPESPDAAPAKPDATKPGDRDAGRRKTRATPRRVAGRLADSGQRLAEWRDQDLAERRERLAGATGRRIRRRASQGVATATPAVPAGPKTEALVHEPVRMKEFCSETGLNFMQCLKVLRDQHGITGNVNMTLPTETAELLAMHFGIEVRVIPAKTRLDELKEEFERRERHHLVPRPPVVTMLGHVDHGKTSLLDAIRKARVVDAEDGGITQHIGAYHIKAGYGAVTFLDTPGHEAFTAMRARGAHLTDVVVLVVAADDGVMPQTVEAINHAKAAKVPVVVALNKIDLGEENTLRIYGQLTAHGLTPSGEWGGDVDVIPTSAVKRIGIDRLVSHLADLSSLLELRADPTLSAMATVIEAETKPGVGPVARVLVRDGTLRIGDAVVCGPSSGKVRALLNDLGQRIEEASPGLPAELWGLDDVPAAGDGLYVVENLQRAKEIATETKRERVERARVQTRKVKTLEEVVLRRDSDEVPELNAIIKADVDGSVMALRQALADLPSDEVRLTIRHAGVGAVNDGDVLLAATCNGTVIAFRVETPATVRRMAEQHTVDVRTYRVIYDVCDDIKKALEGLLAPEERFEDRGTAEVRELFRLGRRIGLIAGCHVIHGVVERSHLAKVIRDGVVVRNACTFASLRRFKDDVKEVRAGLECGIRLSGFDDVHVGDVIQAYEVVKIARTL